MGGKRCTEKASTKDTKKHEKRKRTPAALGKVAYDPTLIPLHRAFFVQYGGALLISREPAFFKITSRRPMETAIIGTSP